MKRFISSFGLVVLLANSTPAAEKSGFYLKDGDRVVFYGDSITDQRLYTTFVETYAVTRFPKMNLTFVHSGWGGDRVNGGGGGPIDLRLKRDVFAYDPTVMTVMLGMNDGSYQAFKQQIFDDYRKGYEHLVASVREHLPNIRLTLIRPSPFDDVTQAPKFEGGYNKVLIQYGDFVQELAGRNDATVADLNSGVVAALEKAHATDTNGASHIIEDRVHPGAPGQLLMANELLKAWNAPALVSDVEIAATPLVATRAEGTALTDLTFNNSLSWDQKDTALPMPIKTNDPIIALVVQSSDIVKALDREMLKVTGLTADSYLLKIDGKPINTFSKEQLAGGINLALLPTPMFKQADEVHALTLEHNNTHFARWRQFQVPYADTKNPKIKSGVAQIMEGLDEDEANLIKRQHEAAQPKSHHFELVPAA